MGEIREKLEKAINVTKIEVPSGELDLLTGEISAFLKWLEPMSGLKTDSVKPILVSHGAVNAMREDKAKPGDLTLTQKAAPNFEDGYYPVPPIIE